MKQNFDKYVKLNVRVLHFRLICVGIRRIRVKLGVLKVYASSTLPSYCLRLGFGKSTDSINNMIFHAKWDEEMGKDMFTE